MYIFHNNVYLSYTSNFDVFLNIFDKSGEILFYFVMICYC